MTYQYALAALAGSTRRRILETLLESPSSVGGLADGLPVSRPAVSQHLRILKETELVSETRDGVRRIYRVYTAGLVELRAYLESFWGNIMTSYKEFADRRVGESHMTHQEIEQTLSPASQAVTVRKVLRMHFESSPTR